MLVCTCVCWGYVYSLLVPQVNNTDLRKASLKDAAMALEHAGTSVVLLVENRPDGKGRGIHDGEGAGQALW